MNMLTFCSIKYMNRSFFSKTRYIIGVGLKKNWAVHPYQNYPQVTTPGIKCISLFLIAIQVDKLDKLYLRNKVSQYSKGHLDILTRAQLKHFVSSAEVEAFLLAHA